MPLSDLVQGLGPALPLILMDHQPARLDEAQQAGVDLILFGHTHRRQLFPNQYLTRLAFEIDWGYLRKGAMRVVVSLGFGTWGPLIRIGSRPKHALGHEKRLHGALTADMVMTLRAPSSGCMAYSPGRQRPLVKPILSRNLVAGGT